MHAIQNTARRFLAGLAPALLLGCATMSVDVDVYTGPLANHEDVQTRQLAVLAVGAKPILDEVKQQAVENNDGKTHGLVRQVLRLYDQKGTAEYRALLSRGERALKDFKEAAATLQQSKYSWSDRGIVNNKQLDLFEVETLHAETPDTRASHLPSLPATPGQPDCGTDVSAQVDALQELQKAYATFLGDLDADGFRQKEGIFWAHFRLWYALLDAGGDPRACLGAFGPLELFGMKDAALFKFLREQDPDGPAGTTYPCKITRPGEFLQCRVEGLQRPVGSNRLFAKLEDEKFVRLHANLLLSDDNNRQRFINRVTRIARAFREAREAQELMFRVALDTLVLANTPARGIANSTTRDRVNRASAEMVATLVSPEALRVALEGSAAGSLDWAREHLYRALTAAWAPEADNPRGGTLPDMNHWSEGGRAPFERQISRALLSDPSTTARALLDLHESFQIVLPTADEKTEKTERWQRYKRDPERRLYGLIRGPTLEAQEAVSETTGGGELAWAYQVFEETAEFAQDSFDAGRVEDGLERLIQNYVDAVDDAAIAKGPQARDEADGKVREARARLLNALTQFAEKVLTVANNDVLLTSPRKMDESQRRRNNVLQAIANSILVQVHAARTRDAHRADIERRARWENHALSQHYPRNPQDVLDAVRDQLSAKRKALEAPNVPEALSQEANSESDVSETGAEDVENAEITRLQEALDELDSEATRKWLASYPPEAAGAHRILLDYVRHLRRVTGDGDRRAQAQTAADVITSEPFTLVVLDPSDGEADARDALDQLIAHLRHEYVNAVAQKGTEDARAKNLAAALAVAYEQRSGMVYIMPTSTYLRTSFAATGLKQNQSLLWRNELLRHGLRQFGPVGERLQDHDALRTLGEIDKQFWQNINRIRVAGAGNTNYVIAKDDIGNWYVKNYAADSKPIIDSAQALAMYAAGAGLGMDLVRELPIDGQVPKKAPTGQPAGPEGTVMGRQYGLFRARYRQATQQDYKQTMTQAESLRAVVRAAWANAPAIPEGQRQPLAGGMDTPWNTLKAAIVATEALRTEEEARATSAKEEPDLSRPTADLLHAIRRFAGTAATGVEAVQQSVSPEMTPEVKAEAARILKGVVRDTLDRLVERRLTTVDRYETTLAVLLEANAQP